MRLDDALGSTDGSIHACANGASHVISLHSAPDH